MIRVRSRQGLSLIELLIVIAIIGVLIALLLPAVQRARDAASRSECANNIRQIGLALHSYHDSHGVLPPGVSHAGVSEPFPFMSWNTRLLPYLEQPALWSQAQAAYQRTPNFLNDPPHPIATVVRTFLCPSDSRVSTPHAFSDTVRAAFTSYLGVEGRNQFRQDGLLYLNSRVRFGEVTDGLSHTLLVGERPPSSTFTLGWWYAGWGQNQDGSAEMVLGVQERNFGKYSATCPAGPYTYSQGSLSEFCDAFHFWSPHLGGATFLFADGSVHLIPYSAAPIMPALATRSGGETPSLSDL
jgi:prepilin-type N-terminal cleavage/methylation domain-containing protein/prepilin-type processing-associated H-X9-DG protein